MRGLVNIGNGLLLVVAWLLLLPVLHFSLVTGLAPAIAGVLFLGVTLVMVAVFRASVAGPAVWRKMLPVGVAVLCFIGSYRTVERAVQQRTQQNGTPRRYYSSEKNP
ncbi:hypothetical protein GCM10028821_25280 [Hymenobacter jeollabukensis]